MAVAGKNGVVRVFSFEGQVIDDCTMVHLGEWISSVLYEVDQRQRLS